MTGEQPFVERVFELDGGELPIRFYPPFRAPGGEFACRWSIVWPEREVSLSSRGVDGVQALILAMRTVHSELVESAAYKDGRLTLHGEAYLDLPPTWDAGMLCPVPPPPSGSG
jgi:hypothetical protein